MTKPSAKTVAFLAQLAEPNPPSPQAATRSPAAKGGPDKKHIGGYFEPDLVEKFAVLKARLKMDNSELIKFMTEATFAELEAGRVFGGR